MRASRLDIKVNEAFDGSGLIFDYKWKLWGQAIGVDLNAEKMLIKAAGSEAVVYDATKIREYKSEWIERSSGSSITKEQYTVVIFLKDLERPKVTIKTITESQTDYVMEMLSQAFDHLRSNSAQST